MICKPLDLRDASAILRFMDQHPALNWTHAMLMSSLNAAQNQAFGLFKQTDLSCFALFQVVAEEAELLLIATHPDCYRQQYATQLLQHVCKNFNAVFLEVRASNIPARRLYEAMGFQYQGLRKAYYTQPTEDAAHYWLSHTAN